MTSMNIQTANDSVIEAIKAIVALDPETILSYDDDGYLDEADQKDLAELINAKKRGELECVNLDEFDLEMRSFLKKGLNEAFIKQTLSIRPWKDLNSTLKNLHQRRKRSHHYYFVFLLSSLAFISSAASRSSCAFSKALRAFSKRLEFLTLGLSS